MSTSIHIRPATTEDAAQIAAIFEHYVLTSTATFETVAPTTATWGQRIEHNEGNGYPTLVAYDQHTVLGYATAGPWRVKPAYANTVEDSIYIAPSATGLGVGSMLLGTLVEQCTARGFAEMIAVIADTASTASVRLHEAHGFTKVGYLERVGHKHNTWLGTTIMQRSLRSDAR